jgi:hypothetical protein
MPSRAAAAAVLLAATLASARAQCYAGCRFSFCPGDASAYAAPATDVAFTPPICDPSGAVAVGHVDATAEAYVVAGGANVKISQWAPGGLSQPFAGSFFKSFSVDGTVYAGDLSGVGHEVAQGNQAGYLDGQCFFLPLRSYQVLGDGGAVVDNIHPTDDFKDCVAFQVGGAVAPVSGEKSNEVYKDYYFDSGPKSPSTPKPSAYESPATPKPPAYESPVTPKPPAYESPATPKPPAYESPATPKPPAYESPATPKPPAYESPATPKPPAYEYPVTAKPSAYEYPATPKPPAYESPATPMPPAYESPATPMPPAYESPATPEPPAYESPVTPKPPAYESPATPMPSAYESPATTKPPAYEYPATTKPPAYEAPVTTSPSYTTAPAYTSATYTSSEYVMPSKPTEPIGALPTVQCTKGCPLPGAVTAMYKKCVDQLAGRDIADYWIFAAANGQSSVGKTCGTADASNVQLCTGTFQKAEFCDAGFACGPDAEAYRPELVQCVATDGTVCTLSSAQINDIVLEKIEGASDFFISCKQ